jgi:hypothetical protein
MALFARNRRTCVALSVGDSIRSGGDRKDLDRVPFHICTGCEISRTYYLALRDAEMALVFLELALGHNSDAIFVKKAPLIENLGKERLPRHATGNKCITERRAAESSQASNFYLLLNCCSTMETTTASQREELTSLASYI